MASQPRRRNGFLIITVLVLLVVVVITTSWMLRSASIRHDTVQRQIDSYEQHHDMLSIRHICLRWISRQRTLEESAGDPLLIEEPPLVYQAELPDGMMLDVYLERAQGLPQRDLDGTTSGDQRELLEGVLDRLALLGDADELTRNIGPIRMVLTTVPDIVIEAIAGGETAVYDALIKARSEGTTNPGAIQTEMQNFGVSPERASLIASDLFANDTRLWRLTVDATRNGNRRTYHLYMTQEGEQSLLAWKILDARLIAAPAEGEDARL